MTEKGFVNGYFHSTLYNLKGGTTNALGSTYTTTATDFVVELGSSTNVTCTLGSDTFQAGEVRFIVNNTVGSTVTLSPGIGSIGGSGNALASSYSLGSHKMAIVTRRGDNFWVVE